MLCRASRIHCNNRRLQEYYQSFQRNIENTHRINKEAKSKDVNMYPVELGNTRILTENLPQHSTFSYVIDTNMKQMSRKRYDSMSVCGFSKHYLFRSTHVQLMSFFFQASRYFAMQLTKKQETKQPNVQYVSQYISLHGDLHIAVGIYKEPIEERLSCLVCFLRPLWYSLFKCRAKC